MNPEAIVNLVEKSEQVTRIYSDLYKERKTLYTTFSENKDQQILERLKTINLRERKVLEALEKNKAEILKNIDLAKEYSNIHKSLEFMSGYFEQLIQAQNEFLDKELLMIEGKINWKQALKDFYHYFNVLDSFEKRARKCNKYFFSPKEFQEVLKANESSLPVQVKNILVNTTVFVLIFIGISTTFSSLEELKLFDVSKLPSINDLLRFVVIASIISMLNLPARVLNGVKSSKRAIIEALNNLVIAEAEEKTV
ncbi:hypothetical protein HY837_03665 [archaeon]|nr:hypothetical protein [archaeon]